MRYITLFNGLILALSFNGIAAQHQHVVVKSRAVVPVTLQPGSSLASSNQPISVINQPNSTMSIDNSAFIVPPITNDLLDFGKLTVATLFDNNLRVCGDDGHRRCNTAMIRVYTMGDGEGVYNSEEGYGMPLEVGLEGSNDRSVVGLGQSGAVVVASFPIAVARHTVRLSDFGVSGLRFQSDFTDAGAGSFSTTIVIEYALAE